jgi:hypothetical protein
VTNTGGGSETFWDVGAYEYKINAVRDWQVLEKEKVLQGFPGSNPLVDLHSLDLGLFDVFDLQGKPIEDPAGIKAGSYLVRRKEGNTYYRVILLPR